MARRPLDLAIALTCSQLEVFDKALKDAKSLKQAKEIDEWIQDLILCAKELGKHSSRVLKELSAK
jgi:hypothetical protein